MARCPSCDSPLPEDREAVGARCPSCHDPLYEPPSRYARRSRPDEAACAVHPDSESVTTCSRCGNYACETCRTRWRGQVWCAACVNRALEAGEGTPEQARAHFRQALLSLGFGVGAWVVFFVAFLLMAVGVAQGVNPKTAVFLFLGLLVMVADVPLAALGMGQALAALRTRGNHMILATVGLIISGLYVGAFLGLGTFTLWQN